MAESIETEVLDDAEAVPAKAKAKAKPRAKVADAAAEKPKAKPKAKVQLDDEEEDLDVTKDFSVDDPALLLPIKFGVVTFADIPIAKKTVKSGGLFEINEAEERLNKKKYSEIKPVETLTKAIRGGDRRGEESQEEMEARIARLLKEEDRGNYDPDKIQICTKCGIFPVAEMYTIDRNLGYCEECASILRLGETKEAKTFEFGIGNQDAAEIDPEADVAY
jgi:hypothetical protein